LRAAVMIWDCFTGRSVAAARVLYSASMFCSKQLSLV
jgi:hypothetical protein